MFLGIVDLGAFIVATFFIILAPGPNSLYVFSLAIQSSKKAAFQGASGIFLGDATLMLLAAIGASSLLIAFPKIYLVVKVVGAVYLFWIGLQLIYNAGKKFNKKGLYQNPAKIVAKKIQSPFLKAYYISLLNPKAIIFLLSFFLQFVDPTYPNRAIPFLVEAIIIQIFSFIYLSSLIILGSNLVKLIANKPNIQGVFQATIGLVFCSISGWLVLSH